MHVRQQIRDAGESLVGGIAGLAVEVNPAATIAEAVARNGPTVVVGTPNESSALSSKGDADTGPLLERTIELAVTIVAEGDTVDDVLDGWATEIEKAFGEDLNGMRLEVVPTGAVIDRKGDEEGELWFAFLDMTFEVTAYTAIGDPETLL